MKSLLSICFIAFAISCSAQQSQDTTFYSTEQAACKGFQKSVARYIDDSGQSRAVVMDDHGQIYYINSTCDRGYWREKIQCFDACKN